jgi:hypothetical protein
LTYSSLNGANFKMSIAPMMPDSGVLYIGIRKPGHKKNRKVCAEFARFKFN